MKYEFLGYPEKFENHPLSKIVPKYIKDGPVLDVGCGNGNLLAMLKDRFDVEGFDISKVAVKLAKKRGLKVKISSIDDFKTKKKFKTILMIGFLVLSKNPSKDLKKVSEWLHRDGMIILTIPNSTSPKSLFTKRGKYHVYFPSYFEFKRLLRKSGFKVIKCLGAGKLRRFPILSSVVFYVIRPENR